MKPSTKQPAAHPHPHPERWGGIVPTDGIGYPSVRPIRETTVGNRRHIAFIPFKGIKRFNGWFVVHQ
ncbi:hypothetical protein PSDT_1399 [Parascardovia denticolens DSM 10105 = JCM 12538]|nr:hypothetical protein PSDT_1399 [Parascardovia denticolens DSM 10105 = JCM 12538]